MTKPNILIVHASGTNRDEEAARACTLAGGAPEIVHLNRLRRGEKRFDTYQMLLIPGGFSYGDALGAGTRLALDMNVFFTDELHEFVASGKPVLGICNGFQVLVKAGLLPGWEDNDRPTTNDQRRWTDIAGQDVAVRRSSFDIRQSTRSVTLTENASGRFECRWVHLALEGGARADWLGSVDDLIFCPVAHGEGNVQIRDDAVLARLEEAGCVALRYVDAAGRRADGAYPLNPNGSAGDIAGLCNIQGNVLGLMPHPEDHVTSIQNPLGGSGQLGLALFRAMIQSI